MHKKIEDFIYSAAPAAIDAAAPQLLADIDALAVKAFTNGDADAVLQAHRILYVINLAHIGTSWQRDPKNVAHPAICAARYKLEQAWEAAERKKYEAHLSSLPPLSEFHGWIQKLVENHQSCGIHPIFFFLRDEATFPQMRDFTLQETPLEMLFGDIVALMLPGIYGQIKVELAKNFWDEVGHAEDECVHRNLRARLMEACDIPADCYRSDINLFIAEELALINSYLCIAGNRAKLNQLIGMMLATELVIPGRFEYLIAAWRRLGFKDETLTYLIEHTTVDVVHAQDWLNIVVMDVLQANPATMADIVYGVCLRLDLALAVSDRLFERVKAIPADAAQFEPA